MTLSLHTINAWNVQIKVDNKNFGFLSVYNNLNNYFGILCGFVSLQEKHFQDQSHFGLKNFDKKHSFSNNSSKDSLMIDYQGLLYLDQIYKAILVD